MLADLKILYEDEKEEQGQELQWLVHLVARVRGYMSVTDIKGTRWHKDLFHHTCFLSALIKFFMQIISSHY